MRLAPVQQSNPPIKLQCVKCGKMVDADKLLADLDGKPFVDYYCKECTAEYDGRYLDSDSDSMR
jgi:hypothetical protein